MGACCFFSGQIQVGHFQPNGVILRTRTVMPVRANPSSPAIFILKEEYQVVSTVTRDPFMLGSSVLALPRPDRVLAIICESDRSSSSPIFMPGQSDALALLLDQKQAVAVFSRASLILEDMELNAPYADELNTSCAIARWELPGARTLVIGVDTARHDTAQHQLHMAQGEQHCFARYQSPNFTFLACQQPYLIAAIKGISSRDKNRESPQKS